MPDLERRRALRVMKGVALGALLFMAVVFVVAFVLQERVPALAYVRAAAEGGMVGALADWFAVTALFRHPLGIPIPHTAIIPRRKDEIGRTLGEFVETNFLAAPVVRAKLDSAAIAERLGAWVRRPENSERVVAEASSAASRVLRALSDDDVREILDSLVREHVVDVAWGPPLGARLDELVASGAHRRAVDLAAESLATWLEEHRGVFDGLVSKRLPSWIPSLAHRLVDDTVSREVVALAHAVRDDPDHPARRAIDDYLTGLADDLQHNPAAGARLEELKGRVFDSPRVRGLAADAWSAVRAGLLRALADPQSGLRRRAVGALQEIGERVGRDGDLRARLDVWITDAAVALIDRHGSDIASIITDTVDRWDPAETTDKIELLVGRDLQYIRLNGTIVGALAGLAIFTLAHTLLGGLSGL